MIKKILMVLSFLYLTIASPVMASGTTDYKEAQNLIEQKIECSKLSSDQLEEIGDYYMELMAPNQGHEIMDEMMGGEGSESLRQAHILMARRWYCGDAAGLGMMGMMTGNYGPSMMNWDNSQINKLGLYNGNSSMMSGFGWGNNITYGLGYGSGWIIIIHILIAIFLIVGIAAFIKFLMNKK